MKKQILIGLFSLQLMNTSYAQLQVVDADLREATEADDYFGRRVEDKYRWLEDENSKATQTWVENQNKKTFAYLNGISFRPAVRKELEVMWNFEKFGSPFKEGKYYFFYKNDGLQNQSVLYIQEGLQGKPSVFLDPNNLNDEGTAALNAVSVSKKQKYAAYAVSNAGSDWQEIFVLDVQTKKLLSDKIEYSKFSGISWKGDEGFYYAGYDRPQNESEKYSAVTEFQKIFFHKIGTSQKEDKLIYEDKEHPQRYKGVGLSDDERWLMLTLSEGTNGSELHYFDLKDPNQKEFKLQSKGFDINQDFVENINGQFLIFTNFNAPNYCLMLAQPGETNPRKWKTFIAPKEDKLESVSRVGNKLICTYLHHASSRVDVYSLNGVFENTITLPGIGTASGFDGGPEDDHTFYAFSSFNKPATIYKYDLASKKSTLFKEPKVKADLANTTVEQRWFTSKDGTKVPMFLYYKKGLNLKSGTNPVFLYGYGGFNISLTPSFSIPMSYFVQQGGIYAVVNLRGGSEFGEQWHEAGMLEKKQNVFDDFIAGAEFLIKERITNPDKIAIHGRSNGGLLVGACMTQRPDLFEVALPGVGVLDMLRYHKFTVGWGWVVEYGSSDNKEQFEYLIKYSPLHNTKPGTSYPATLVTTADHDDRVVPAHSYKFISTLQDHHVGKNPVLIRIDVQAGHGAGKPTSKQISEWADVLSFTMQHLKMR